MFQSLTRLEYLNKFLQMAIFKFHCFCSKRCFKLFELLRGIVLSVGVLILQFCDGNLMFKVILFELVPITDAIGLKYSSITSRSKSNYKLFLRF